MTDGYYIIELLRRPEERTIVNVEEGSVTWLGGDETSTPSQLLSEWRVVAQIDMRSTEESTSALVRTGADVPNAVPLDH